MLRTLFGTSIALIDSTLDDRGLTPLLLNQKPRYAVSVYPMKDFSAFTLNPDYASLCRTISNAFIWSLDLFLVITSMSYMYARTMSNPSNILDIFCWKISGLLQTLICSL